MRYRDSIKEFMRRLGAGKYVVVVIDDGYLRSANCMFELTEIAHDPAFASRVFPVIMSDAAIFNPVRRLGYVKHWENEIRELDAAMREVGPENLQGVREERDLYETIRNTIARIVDIVADMNALTPEVHRDTDFAQLYQALDAALGEHGA
jgi:internalin A